MPLSYEDLVEQVLDTRINELSFIKRHVLSISDFPSKCQVASYTYPRIYGLYESGLKEFANLFLAHVDRQIASVADLADCYLTWRHSDELRSHITQSSTVDLLGSLRDFDTVLRGIAQTKKIAPRDEYRTMDPANISKILNGLGWTSSVVNNHSAAISLICGKRHDVAHGDASVIARSASFYSTFSNDISIVEQMLYEWATTAVDPTRLQRIITSGL